MAFEFHDEPWGGRASVRLASAGGPCTRIQVRRPGTHRPRRSVKRERHERWLLRLLMRLGYCFPTRSLTASGMIAIWGLRR
jgi:hypothetical protein